MIADEEGAIVLDNGNCFVNRDGNIARYIIIHKTAGGDSAESIASYFQSTRGTNNPVSAHYVVGKNGDIVQCNRESDGAWANGYISGAAGSASPGNSLHDFWWDAGINPNNLTVAIEHIDSSSDNSNFLTPQQKQASFKLIYNVCIRHNIPMRQADVNGGITGHYSIDPINRARCPGNYPWSELWEYLSENGDGTMLSIQQSSDFFEEVTADQRWRCKQTNIDIAYGILNYYRTCTQIGLNGLSQYGLPVSDEEGIPNTKQAVLQRFERGVIIYDPNKEVDSVPGLSGMCYPAHIDKGPGQDPRILAALSKQKTATKTGTK